MVHIKTPISIFLCEEVNMYYIPQTGIKQNGSPAARGNACTIQ